MKIMESITRTKQVMGIDGLVANSNNRIEVTSTAQSLQLAESNFSNTEYVFVGGLQLVLKNDGTYRVVGRGDVQTSIIDIPTEYNSAPVTEIGVGAFMNDSNLTKVNIPSSITFIGSNAFYRCANLAEVVFYLDDGSDLQIGMTAFCECTSLSSIDLPQRLTTIGKGAFKGCTSLEQVYHGDIKDNRLISIGNEAFMNCTNLKQVLLAGGLKEIGTSAFEGCTALYDFNFVSSITKIGTKAFKNCLGMTSLTLPDSLIFIGANAFLIDPVPEYSYSRYIAFADPYTWFTSLSDEIDYGDLTLRHPTYLYDANDSSITSGANRQNGNRLSLNSDGNLGGYFWHKLKQMPTPEISVSDGILNMTDPLGVAEHFYIYVNGKKKVTIDV